MSSTMRRIIVIASTVIFLGANFLDNTGLLPGRSIGVVSDRTPTLITPAGWAFAIWGIIFAGLLAFTVWQALPAQAENPRLDRIAPWYLLNSLAIAGWIAVFRVERFGLAALLMAVILGTLIVINAVGGVFRAEKPTAERLAVDLPFSIYTGWITAASVIAAVVWAQDLTPVLFGLGAVPWSLILLGAVAVIGVMVSYIISRGNYPYALTLIWAMGGIIAAHDAPIATGAAVVIGVLVVGGIWDALQRGGLRLTPQRA